MADENTPNREGLPITTGDAGGMQRTDDFTGQINPPEPEPRPPRPDDGHNRDGHHHHGHQHNDDDETYSDEIDDSVPDIDTFDSTYQSQLLYVNKLNIAPLADNDPDNGMYSAARVKFQSLGLYSQNNNQWSQNSISTFNLMTHLISQYPQSDLAGNGNPIKLAMQRHDFYQQKDFLVDIPTDTINSFESEYTYADASLTPQNYMSLPFPSYWNEFDVFNNGRVPLEQMIANDVEAARVYISDLSKHWGGETGYNVGIPYGCTQEDVDEGNQYMDGNGYGATCEYAGQGLYKPYENYGVGRPDISWFLAVFFDYATQPTPLSYDDAKYLLQTHFPPGYQESNYTYSEEVMTMLSNQIIPTTINPVEKFEYFYNFETIQYSFEMIVPGGDIDRDTDNDGLAENFWAGGAIAAGVDIDIDEFDYPLDYDLEKELRFKLVGHEVNYEDVDFEFPPVPDFDEVIVDNIDLLNDNFQNDEEISSNFGVPNVTIQQTLFNSYDALSGLDIDKSIFQNTRQGLLNSDMDGRIGLGMFSFDDDNLISDNFPDILNEDKFKQIGQQNLVINGSGRQVKSIWKNKGADGKPRQRFFIPEGGWGYCTLDGIAPNSRRRNTALYLDSDMENGADGQQYSKYIEEMTNGPELINSFPQAPNFEEGLDNQDVIGNAGYHAYFFDYRIDDEDDGLERQSLIRLQHNLISSSRDYLGDLDSEFDTCNKFLKQNQVDSLGKQNTNDEFPAVSNHASYLTPRKCTATGQNPTDSDNAETNIWFPNFAKWIIDKDFSDEEGVSCFSYGRCLEFLSTNFRDSRFDFNDNGTDDAEGTDKTFDWMSYISMNTANEGTLGNQYRSLNQVIKIYNPWQDTEINPHTIMEVKFKMKTWSKLYNSENPPMVEIAIIDGDSTTNNPLRTRDMIYSNNNGRYLPYAGRHGYWPHGDFNSTRYSDDINDVGTLNRKYSNFGSMNRFKNTDTDTWETFSYQFTMGDIFRYGNPPTIIRPLYLIVQSTDNFYGRVWLDDFEVYESYDFIPDVDVRKKISIGKFGKGDLTNYYDPNILSQLEAYNDTTAPLEAQFYFYPQYKSDELFDVKRTPMYNDFKKGLFYIHDIDWGDGTPNEFTSEPEPIDEEKVILHTYETSGVFEVTGRMLRTKEDEFGDELGIIKNKKFRLRINVNEGVDEDFRYFGSDGFSFIPHKNTTPIIGGHSKESAYYKGIKRQLGFIGNDKTTIFFKNPGDKLRTEIALNKMDSSFNFELDLLMEYTTPRPLQKSLEIIEPICDTYDCGVNQFLESSKFSPPLAPTVDNVSPEHLSDLPFPSNLSEFDLNEDNNISNVDATNWNLDYSRPDISVFLLAYLLIANTETPTQETVYAMIDSLQEQNGTSYVIPQNITIPLQNITDLREFDYFRNPIQTYTAVLTCSPLDVKCVEFYGNGAITQFDGETWNLENLSSMVEGFTYRFGIFESDYQGEFCNEALGCDGLGTGTGIPFAGGVELIDIDEDDIDDTINLNSNYVDFTVPVSTEFIYTGFNIYSEELGKGIGDCDLTSIKYSNTIKPMWKMLGLIEPNIDDFTAGNGPELIQNTDFGPLEAGTYGSDEYVGNITWQHNTPPELKTDVIDGWDLFNEGPYAGNNMKLSNYYTSNLPFDDDRYPGYNVLSVNITNSGRNRLIQVRSKDNIVEDGKKYRVRIELYPNEDYPPSLAFHPPVLTIDGGTNQVTLQEGVNEFEWDVVFPNEGSSGKIIISNQLGQSGGHGFNLVSVSISEFLQGEGIEFDTQEEADEAFNLDHPNNPMSPRYWKNIIPQDYSIYNREGIIDGELVDFGSEQEWLDGYYYPVLPKYGNNGEFFQDVDGEIVSNPYPNGNIPYPLESSITDEKEFNKDLLINITSETIETNTFSDNSGNQNYGFGFVDYKPEFDDKTSRPKKRKSMKTIKSATNNGAF